MKKRDKREIEKEYKMAQLNIYTFLSQISWFLIINIIVYFIYKKYIIIKYTIINKIEESHK